MVTLPCISVATSMPGRIREKYEAEIMTPAAKPRSVSLARREIERPNRTGIAPMPVISPAPRLARTPIRMMFMRASLFFPASGPSYGKPGGRANCRIVTCRTDWY